MQAARLDAESPRIKVRKQMGYFFAHKKPARQNHAGFELKEQPISPVNIINRGVEKQVSPAPKSEFMF